MNMEENKEPSDLDLMMRCSWQLCAIEDENGYEELVYADEAKTKVLSDISVGITFDPTYSSKSDTGYLWIGYVSRYTTTEDHVYHFYKKDDGFGLSYDGLSQFDSSYETWRGKEPDSPDWPFVLPYSGETWFMKYDRTTDRILIERTKEGEESPYIVWYLEEDS